MWVTLFLVSKLAFCQQTAKQFLANSAATQWNMQAQVKKPILAADCAIHEGRLYLLAKNGFKERDDNSVDSLVERVLSYDLQTGEWHEDTTQYTVQNGPRAIVYDKHLLYIGEFDRGANRALPQLWVKKPDSSDWEYHDLPSQLNRTGTYIGFNGVMLGLVNNGTRVVACGGLNGSFTMLDTCYYLERNGTSLRLGKAPTMGGGPRRGACIATDGNSMIYAGGQKQRDQVVEDKTSTKLRDMGVLRYVQSRWAKLKGEGLLKPSQVVASIRLGDHLWCLGASDGVTTFPATQVLDLPTGTTTEAIGLPTGEQAVCAALDGNRVWLVTRPEGKKQRPAKLYYLDIPTPFANDGPVRLSGTTPFPNADRGYSTYEWQKEGVFAIPPKDKGPTSKAVIAVAVLVPILCVLGLCVALYLGWRRRQRKRDAMAKPPSMPKPPRIHLGTGSERVVADADASGKAAGPLDDAALSLYGSSV